MSSSHTYAVMSSISDLELDALIDEFSSDSHKQDCIAIFDTFSREMDEIDIAEFDQFAQQEKEAESTAITTTAIVHLPPPGPWLNPFAYGRIQAEADAAMFRIRATHAERVWSEMLKKSPQGVWIYSCVT